ncbi:MAG: hypothetical protein IJU50_11435, partial [Lachnospiraceae bacterium]|nr:hypothetical protein [Lachnospiraceae bacterium]
MKALVVEKKNGKTTALREDGVFISVNQDCQVGDTIELKAPILTVSWNARRFMATAAVLALCFFGSGYGYLNVAACSYVSLDVNPSLEFVLNRRDRLLTVNGLNEEGETLSQELLSLPIKGKSLGEALSETERLLLEEGKVQTDAEQVVLINITTDTDERAERLTEEARERFPETEGPSLATSRSTKEDRKAAKQLGISAGKYQEILLLEGSSENVSQNIDNYKDISLPELLIKTGKLPKESIQNSLQEDETEMNRRGLDNDQKERGDGFSENDSETGKPHSQNEPPSQEGERVPSSNNNETEPPANPPVNREKNPSSGSAQETPSGNPKQSDQQNAPSSETHQPNRQENADSEAHHPNGQENADSDVHYPNGQENADSEAHHPNEQENADSEAHHPNGQENADSEENKPNRQEETNPDVNKQKEQNNQIPEMGNSDKQNASTPEAGSPNGQPLPNPEEGSFSQTDAERQDNAGQPQTPTPNPETRDNGQEPPQNKQSAAPDGHEPPSPRNEAPS